MDAPRLLPALPAAPLPPPDEDARVVLERSLAGEDLVVIGAPGTGKTTLALHLLATHVEAGSDALLLAPTRGRADGLRRRASHLLGGAGVVRVRTPASLALSVLTTSLTARPDPLPAPVLLAGAEEDAALAALVHRVEWPGLPREAVASRAFRGELRNLLARAGELGVDAEQLASLGRTLGIPLWGPASELVRLWDAQGRPSPERRAETRRMDPARLQDRAVEALATWEVDGVTVSRPVPDVVIVDDYQDCTAATARLLAALATPDGAGHRSHVVVLGDPDAAVETFRGGAPSLLVEAEDRSGLGATRLTLTTVHRGTTALASVVADQAARVPVTGTAAHRRTRPARDLGEAEGSASESAPGAGPHGVEVLLATLTAQEAAHVARALRGEHIHHATPWDQMAVVVRSAGHAERVGRELRRRGVPLASRTPAVLLRAEPAAAALLAVARAGVEEALGDGTRPPERPAALDLLTSPLIGLTPMDLRRLRRRLRRDRPVQSSPDEYLLAVLASPDGARALARELAEEPLAAQAALLVRAAEVISAVTGLVGQSRAGGLQATASPTGQGEHRVDAEALLWAAWSASGCSQDWRTAALGVRAPAGTVDAVLAEAAERDLDVVTALFKRAEVWSERHPGAPAGDFLAELAAEVLPSDSVAPQGVRPAGVAVLTPAASAGREWPVVAVMGLTQDTWPDLRPRDSLTRAGLLVDAVTGRLPLGPDGIPTGELDPVTARAQVRGDERRMLVSALSRATRRLLVTSTADADHAPSPFLLEVAAAAGLTVTDPDGVPVTCQDVGDLTLRGLVGELRHAAVAGTLDSAGPVERARAAEATTLLGRLAAARVPGADPREWAGVGGPTSRQALVPPGGRVRVSPSDVEGLHECPLRWFLTRQGGGRPASGAQALGTLVHAVAERAEREHLRGQALMDAFEERLPELGYPDTWLGQLDAERARAMIARLDAYLAAGPPHAEVETVVDTAVDLSDPATGQTVPVRIVGRIDRLETVDHGAGPVRLDGSGAAGSGDVADQPTRRVRVIDLKTGRRAPADPARHPQLTTYRLALQAQGADVVGGALLLLGKEMRRQPFFLTPPGAALDPSPDPGTGEDWATALVAGAALAATGPTLQARTGKDCPRCVVRTSCPIRPEGKRTVT